MGFACPVAQSIVFSRRRPLPRGYPGLVLDDGGGDVPGSLLTAPDLSAIWENLDEFEGNEYERVVASVTLAGRAQARATVYVLRQSTGA